jgi:hypothetical protein
MIISSDDNMKKYLLIQSVSSRNCFALKDDDRAVFVAASIPKLAIAAQVGNLTNCLRKTLS